MYKTHFSKANLLFREGKFEEAVLEYKKIILNCEAHYYYENMGMAFERLKRLDEAQRAYEKCLIIDGKSVRANHFFKKYNLKKNGSKISDSEQIKLIKSTKHVHRKWYMKTYSEVLEQGIDPVKHYFLHGADLLYNPGKNFNTKFYIETYPDAKMSGLNPLVHYALFGKELGYITLPKKDESLKQFYNIRSKLLSLGFTDLPLEELKLLVTQSAKAQVRHMAARAIASWYMYERTETGYHNALYWINIARKDLFDANSRTKLITMELICLYQLNDLKSGLNAYKLANIDGKLKPDNLLAYSNFQSVPEKSLQFINQVLDTYGIEPIGLLSDETKPVYDRLICSQNLHKVKGGPKVTVLIAVYDSADMLTTALRSLQAQTWQNLEIIVIDDCSPTTETISVANNFADRDPRIRVYELGVNGGAYVARNHGLKIATGDFVTLHDADDWSHPKKIETQVRFLMENDSVVGCTSEQVRADNNLKFTRLTQNINLIMKNTSSLMWRRLPVLEKLGCWDSVRFGADTDFLRRMIEAFGKNSIVSINTGPLSFQRNLPDSSVNNRYTAANSEVFGFRKYYSEIRNVDLIENNLNFNTSKPIYPAPRYMRPNRVKGGGVRYFKTAICSDFRLQGGTTQSSVQEMIAHHKFGIDTAVIQLNRYDFNPERPIERVVLNQIDEQKISFISYGDEIECELLIIRYPPILYHFQSFFPKVRAKEIKVIINQPPMSDYGPNGVVRYELDKCAENIRRYFGIDAIWHPIGPLVRDALQRHHADQLHHIRLSDSDWNNIIDISSWDKGKRKIRQDNILRIGRHSRDHEHKWPDTKHEILAAYPDCKDVEVHILGGGRTPRKILGYTPKNWVVHNFGSIHPKEFLHEIDIWIYFANPNWIESFGRTIIEAMASGVPVILPEIYRPLFEDSVIYATPETALNLAKELHADPISYQRQVAKAREYVREKFSFEMHLERIKYAGVDI